MKFIIKKEEIVDVLSKIQGLTSRKSNLAITANILIKTSDTELSLMATDVENILIEIEGNLVFCKKSSFGRYLSGISFIGTDEQVVTFVTKLIKEYNFRKRNLPSKRA